MCKSWCSLWGYMEGHVQKYFIHIWIFSIYKLLVKGGIRKLTAGTTVQQPLAQVINSHWHNSSTVTGMIVQQSLAQFFNIYWHDSSTVTVVIIQQLLWQMFNSHWHDSSTVTGMIVKQSLGRLCNIRCHNFSTVTGTVVQQWWARFFPFSMLAEFFNSDVQCWRIMPCTRNATHDPIQL